MAKSFHKLNKKFSIAGLASNVCRGKLTQNYGVLKYFTLEYRSPEIETVIRALQPDGIKWMEGTKGTRIAPHRDLGMQAALNIYVQPNNGVTTFWPEEDTSKSIASLVTSAQKESFLACQGDCYLLDVSKVHAVLTGEETDRLIIQLNWKHLSYADLLNKVISL